MLTQDMNIGLLVGLDSSANVFERIDESAEVLPDGVLMRLRGTFVPMDVKGINGRWYVHEEYEPHVQSIQPKIAAKTLFGEIEHPPRVEVPYDLVSHRIDEVKYNAESNSYVGIISILDTDKGRKVYDIAKTGAPIYVSHRALGSADKKTGKGIILKLITWDVTSNPSFNLAEFNGEMINESVGFIALNESELAQVSKEFGFGEEQIDIKQMINEALAGLETKLPEIVKNAITLHYANESAIVAEPSEVLADVTKRLKYTTIQHMLKDYRYKDKDLLHENDMRNALLLLSSKGILYNDELLTDKENPNKNAIITTSQVDSMIDSVNNAEDANESIISFLKDKFDRLKRWANSADSMTFAIDNVEYVIEEIKEDDKVIAIDSSGNRKTFKFNDVEDAINNLNINESHMHNFIVRIYDDKGYQFWASTESSSSSVTINSIEDAHKFGQQHAKSAGNWYSIYDAATNKELFKERTKNEENAFITGYLNESIDSVQQILDAHKFNVPDDYTLSGSNQIIASNPTTASQICDSLNANGVDCEISAKANLVQLKMINEAVDVRYRKVDLQKGQKQFVVRLYTDRGFPYKDTKESGETFSDLESAIKWAKANLSNDNGYWFEVIDMTVWSGTNELWKHSGSTVATGTKTGSTDYVTVNFVNESAIDITDALKEAKKQATDNHKKLIVTNRHKVDDNWYASSYLNTTFVSRQLPNIVEIEYSTDNGNYKGYAYGITYLASGSGFALLANLVNIDNGIVYKLTSVDVNAIKNLDSKLLNISDDVKAFMNESTDSLYWSKDIVSANTEDAHSIVTFKDTNEFKEIKTPQQFIDMLGDIPNIKHILTSSTQINLQDADIVKVNNVEISAVDILDALKYINESDMTNQNEEIDVIAAGNALNINAVGDDYVEVQVGNQPVQISTDQAEDVDGVVKVITDPVQHAALNESMSNNAINAIVNVINESILIAKPFTFANESADDVAVIASVVAIDDNSIDVKVGDKVVKVETDSTEDVNKLADIIKDETQLAAINESMSFALLNSIRTDLNALVINESATISAKSAKSMLEDFIEANMFADRAPYNKIATDVIPDWFKNDDIEPTVSQMAKMYIAYFDQGLAEVDYHLRLSEKEADTINALNKALYKWCKDNVNKREFMNESSTTVITDNDRFYTFKKTNSGFEYKVDEEEDDGMPDGTGQWQFLDKDAVEWLKDEESDKLNKFLKQNNYLNESSVEVDCTDPSSAGLKKLLKDNNVTLKVINKNGPSGYAEVKLTGKHDDLVTVLKDDKYGWDDEDLAEYINESIAADIMQIIADMPTKDVELIAGSIIGALASGIPLTVHEVKKRLAASKVKKETIEKIESVFVNESDAKVYLQVYNDGSKSKSYFEHDGKKVTKVNIDDSEKELAIDDLKVGAKLSELDWFKDFVNESAKIKDYKKVKVGNAGEDYNGEPGKVLAIYDNYAAFEKSDDKFGVSSEVDEYIEEGYISKTEPIVVIEDNDGEVVAFAYGGHGFYVNESVNNLAYKLEDDLFKFIDSNSSKYFVDYEDIEDPVIYAHDDLISLDLVEVKDNTRTEFIKNLKQIVNDFNAANNTAFKISNDLKSINESTTDVTNTGNETVTGDATEQPLEKSLAYEFLALEDKTITFEQWIVKQAELNPEIDAITVTNTKTEIIELQTKDMINESAELTATFINESNNVNPNFELLAANMPATHKYMFDNLNESAKLVLNEQANAYNLNESNVSSFIMSRNWQDIATGFLNESLSIDNAIKAVRENTTHNALMRSLKISTGRG